MAPVFHFSDNQEPARKRTKKETISSDAVLLDSMHTAKISRLGKVRGSQMPVEYDLMRFIEGIKYPHSSWNTTTPVCKWKGLKCDENDNVETIMWRALGLQGRINVEYLPPKLSKLTLEDNILFDSFEFNSMPSSSSLYILVISENLFSGTPNLYHLPPYLIDLDISDNHFSGYVDFSVMPISLRYLYINNNKALKGMLDVNKAFKNLQYNVFDTQVTTSSGKYMYLLDFDDSDFDDSDYSDSDYYIPLYDSDY